MSSEDVELQKAHILIAIVGVGYLFPFSALTQPVDFWNHIFPDFNIEFPLTTLFMWVNLLVLGGIVFLGRKPSYTFRIVGGFIGQAVVLVLVPSLYFLHLSETTYYYAIMLATAFAAVVTALVDSVAIAFAAHYPTKVQEGLQLGIGLSTLIGSIYRIVTKLIFPPEEVVTSSLIYFYSGALTILFCVWIYFRLLNMSISKKYFHKTITLQEEFSSTPSSSTVYGSMSEDSRHVEEMVALVEGRHCNEADSLLQKQNASLYTDREACRQMGIESHLSQDRLTDLEGHQGAGVVDKWEVLRSVLWNQILVFFLFFSTLLLWPPLVTEIRSYNFPELQESRWWSLLLLLLFAVLDCIGRLMTPFRFGLTAKTIGWPILARLLLIPLLICSSKAIYFTNDFWSILFVGLLGWTNGYLGSLAIIFVNEMAREDQKGLVGSFSGFFLNLGLVFGSTAALGVKSWLDSW